MTMAIFSGATPCATMSNGTRAALDKQKTTLDETGEATAAEPRLEHVGRQVVDVEDDSCST
jgi:hypothetical protein